MTTPTRRISLRTDGIRTDGLAGCNGRTPPSEPVVVVPKSVFADPTMAGERAIDPDVHLIGPAPNDVADAPAPVDGVAVLTLREGQDEPQLVFVNDGLCELTGWRADELLGQPPTKLFARNKGRHEVEAMMRALGLDLPEDEPSTTIDHDGPADPDGSLDILDLIELSESPTRPVAVVDNNGHGSNGHGSNGHGSNGHGSNGHGSDQPGGAGEVSPSVQERAQRMLGSMGEDLFDAPESLFGDISFTTMPSLTALDEDLRSTIDLDVHGGGIGRSYASVTHMLTRDHRQVPVYFTAHMLASSMHDVATLVCQVHDLRKATAERLLADKDAVVASLSRGHELGQLCHQIAVMVERSLGVSATCWILIANDRGELEPVITGGFDADLVAATAAVAQSNAKPVKRVFASASLPPILSGSLVGEGISDLWYVPVMAATKTDDEIARAAPTPASGHGNRRTDDDADPMVEPLAVVDLDGDHRCGRTDQAVHGGGHLPVAAIMVAAGHASPDRKATVLLEHMAEVLGTAVGHAASEVRNHHQALHDPLTRLPNRALIVDRLGQAMARLDRDGVALSVLLVDIDRFKWINDTHGVDVGDRVLVEVAERLLAAVRLGDTVGRIGSDQFMVICVATNGELDTPSVGRRIRRAVSEPITVGDAASTVDRSLGGQVSVSASIGAVVVNEQAQRPATVIGNAELALSQATALGRGKFAMFKAEHQDDVMRRHHIEQTLRQAIANDELVLHYQPIVDISSGVMVGAEALLRWDRPDHGVCGPGTFMPIAEESDLVLDLDRWVINDVCRAMQRWPKLAGRWPLVSINLSARILGSESLVPMIREALERHGLPPIRLGLEITESMQVLDMQTALDNLNRLAKLGSRIAIDDFGVGHASLDYLRTFSMATALKIDRSFVAGLTVSKEDKAIVTASIAMANSLGLDSVAEGVESVEQLLTLREMGCTYAQGFVMAQALPLDIVLEIWGRERLYQPRE